MNEAPDDHFIGEPIRPDTATFDTRMMARGSPGLPRRFEWRGEAYEVTEVLKAWRTTGRCTSGSDEQYVRRHWFTVRTTSGREMTLYADRQARRGQNPKARWWLFSVA